MARKTIMLTEETHSRISKLADKFQVTQPEILEAMLTSIDEMRLQATIAELAKKRRISKAEEARKNALMQKAVKNLNAGQIEALLKQLGVNPEAP